MPGVLIQVRLVLLQVRDIQRNLEEITYLLRIPQRKPFGSMAKDVSAALSHFTPEERPKLLLGVPEEDRAKASFIHELAHA